MTSPPLSVIESLSRLISFYNLQPWLFGLVDLWHIVQITSRTASLQLFFCLLVLCYCFLCFSGPVYFSSIHVVFALLWISSPHPHPGSTTHFPNVPACGSWVQTAASSPLCAAQLMTAGVLSGRLAKLDRKREMIWASRAPAGLLLLLLNTCSWLWC